MDKFSAFDFDMSENTAYDNPEFPAEVKKLALSRYPDFVTMNAWHNETEFVYVLSGDITYVIDGTHVSLTENTGLFINSHRMNYAFNAEKNECTYIRIRLNPSLLSASPMFYSNYVKPFTGASGCDFLYLTQDTEWQSEILTTIKQIYESRNDPWNYFAIQILYMRMFELLYFNVAAPSMLNAQRTTNIYTLKIVLLYIHEHFKEKITLDQISDAGGCGKSKCSELFKDFLNTSPINYLTKYRLTRALYLLRNTSETVSSISELTGFAGTSYFCETFKKSFGISPAEYRNLSF